MKRPNQITGIVVLLVASFFARESSRMVLYTPQGPASGFFPLCASVLMGLMGLVIFLQATFQTSEPMPEDFVPSRSGAIRVCLILAAMAVVMVAMNTLGYIITMFAFLLFMMVGLERGHPVVATAVAVLGSAGVYYLFVHFLAVELPAGLLGI